MANTKITLTKADRFKTFLLPTSYYVLLTTNVCKMAV